MSVSAASLIGVCTGVCLAVCPPMPPECENYEERARLAWEAGAAPGIPAGGDPALVGWWQPPQAWPVIAIHSAMLPTGKVLQYSYPAGEGGSNARLFDPATGGFENVTMSTDIFCSGLSFLGDGRVLVTGGNDYDCDFQGRVTTFTFNPGTQEWTPQDTMSDGRWYPTNTTLGDGRVIITNGLDTHCEYNTEMEIFTPGQGVDPVVEGEKWLPLFARLHLLSDGRIAQVAPADDTWLFTPGTGWQFHSFSSSGWRGESASFLVPGAHDQVMIVGGYAGDGPTASTELIDFSTPGAQWQPRASMHHPRAHADSLILPDGKVLIMGGGQFETYGNPVNIPEMYDPAADEWTELPSHVYGRMYHATTVLLPDGRVLVAGQDSGPSMFWGEIYHPPYLFRGARPIIDSAPSQVTYDQTIAIVTDEAAQIESVAALRLSTVTHSVNFDQRYVGLEFTVSGDAVLATLPSNPNVAPPGYYMLFIVNEVGVPSVASMMKIGPAHPADIDGDGDVGVGDLAAVILAWGACPPGPCAADITGNGFVDVEDLLAVILNWGPTG